MTKIHGSFLITIKISLDLSIKIDLGDWFEISISILLGPFLALFISVWGCIGFGDRASWGENVCTIRPVTPDLLFIFGGQCMDCTHKDDFLAFSLSKSHWLEFGER